MTDGTQYQPDFAGTSRLMRTEEMTATVEAVARAAIPFAHSISPDAPPYGTGYLNNWEVSTGFERIAGAKRSVAELANVSDYAVEVELGKQGDVSVQDTGHHVLARTADHIGHG